MSVIKLVSQITRFFEEVLHKEAHVVGIERRENGWLAQVETVEESEYMRRRALDDIMGLYEVEVNDALEITGYQRISLRERVVIRSEDGEDGV